MNDSNAEADNNETTRLSRKRTHEPESEAEPNNKKNANEHTVIVAAHYNHLEEKGLKARFRSPIFHLRNFNNWVKSVLIQEYCNKICINDTPINVLDVCCGKGGDIGKWLKMPVNHVVFADIAEVSVQQCKARYDSISRRSKYSAEFIAMDCTKGNLKNAYEDHSISFNIVSCQFGLHYSFESLAQARCMLRNITECLKPGGYFFGTLPDANVIISRAQKSPHYEFGNRIYKIKLLFDVKDGYPLFGGKYDFHLEGVVDCPEFLVYFDLLKKLASEYDLELVYKANFSDFYKEHVEKHSNLLHRSMCLENYPPSHGAKLVGEDSEYEHAKSYLNNLTESNEIKRISTMSMCEWEVASVYMAFVFQKSENRSK